MSLVIQLILTALLLSAIAFPVKKLRKMVSNCEFIYGTRAMGTGTYKMPAC